MAESAQASVGHAVGAWCWHARHAAPCRVVDRQDMWGETAYRVWLPTKDAVVRARALRPTGHPRWSGQDFWLIGYRIFVRYTNAQGRGSRGLYILGSETDLRLMARLGNCFTRYRYAFKPMITKVNSDGLTLRTTSQATEKPFNRRDLIGAVQAAVSANPGQSVVIAADKSVKYEQVMNTLNDLRNAGVNKVGLQTQIGKSAR